LLAASGPEVLVQLVRPDTPVIAQIPLALGATALVGPVTVAVKVIVAPKAAVVAPAATVTVGVALATVVV
jgi:hypothetical protein